MDRSAADERIVSIQAAIRHWKHSEETKAFFVFGFMTVYVPLICWLSFIWLPAGFILFVVSIQNVLRHQSRSDRIRIGIQRAISELCHSPHIDDLDGLIELLDYSDSLRRKEIEVALERDLPGKVIPIAYSLEWRIEDKLLTMLEESERPSLKMAILRYLEQVGRMPSYLRIERLLLDPGSKFPTQLLEAARRCLISIPERIRTSAACKHVASSRGSA